MEKLATLNSLATKISPTTKSDADDPESPSEYPDNDAIKMFVGQVPRSMDETELREFFEEFGPVFQLNVLKDKTSGISRGCCFVTYYKRRHALSAQNALHNLKTMPGMNHPIQMKPADTENKNERKLFVGMVNKKLSEDDIKKMFEQFGAIEDCSVLRDDNGISRGCAFVTFASRQVASVALKAMHHCMTMEGCSSPLVVKFADTQREKENKQMQQLQTNLLSLTSLNTNIIPSQVAPTQTDFYTNNNYGGYSGLLGTPLTIGAAPSLQVVNLPSFLPGQTAMVQNLQGLQQQIHPLQMLQIQQQQQLLGGYSSPALLASKDISEGESQKYMSPLTQYIGGMPYLHTGLVQDPKDVQQNTAVSNSLYMPAMSKSPTSPLAGLLPNPLQETLSGSQQIESILKGGKIKTPDGGYRSNPGPEGANLFIYHLPQEFGDSDLHNIFQPFGTIVSAKVFIDKQTNLSKCFGFVSFTTVESAQAAIQAMNGFQIGTKRLKVQVKKPKDASKPY